LNLDLPEVIPDIQGQALEPPPTVDNVPMHVRRPSHMPLTITPAIDAIIASFDAPRAPMNLMDVASKLSIERQAMKERGATEEDHLGLWCERAVFNV
jgi:hypothetical protein